MTTLSIPVSDEVLARRAARPRRGRRQRASLVLRARKAGRIEAARPVLERLRARGMYLADSVLAAALAEVGE